VHNGTSVRQANDGALQARGATCGRGVLPYGLAGMFVKLDGSGGLYEQLYQELRHRILHGQLAPGSRLPSTRTLARELGVSRNTVLYAYNQLLAEGYVVGQTGSGTYVASTLPDMAPVSESPVSPPEPSRPFWAPALSAYGQRVTSGAAELMPSDTFRRASIRYDFRYGLPAVDEFPHAIWRRLLARRMRTATRHSLHYGAPAGYLPLRQAIAAYLRRARAVVCDPEQIVIVNGSQQALDLAARLLLNPGDRVVIEDPNYQGARQVFLAAGARLVAIPVDVEGLATEELPSDAALSRLAYVTPSHQFPSGAIMSLSRRLALLAWAERMDAYILEDDYDSEFRYTGRPLEAVQGLDHSGRVIYVGTFSKVLFPSLRLGYLVLPRPLVAAFTAAKWLTDRHTSTFEQQVLSDFITEGHFERHLRRSRTRYAARLTALLETLHEALGHRIEISGANTGMHLLVWLNHLAPEDMAPFIARAAGVGVGIYSVAPYFIRPVHRAGLLMGYTAMTPDEIRAGVHRLASVLA
jgi:GntR family transcriptional regulator/MocR family aminotransferase